MPIQSMTGFGKGESSGENLKVNVEIKSVNHRFKDLRFKMSSILNSEEIILRKELDSHFKRGSFDIYVSYKKSQEAKKSIEIDQDKVTNFINNFLKIEGVNAENLSINPVDFLKSDFAVEDESKEAEIIKLSKEAFSIAVKSLLESRSAEGSKLMETLEGHRSLYKEQFEIAKKLKNSYQDKVKEKLLKKLESQEGVEVDQTRFQQEVIYYLEKLDIDEEINRIVIHLDKLKEILCSDGEVGRQIEFLLQELNRETNTIGSKTANDEISGAVIQMKVQLEKLREQALNME
jgi:uncharacterized protein (TIGR00255 family)